MRNSGVWEEMLAYDWIGSKFVKPFKRSDPITIGDVIVTTGTKTEEPRDRKLRFLRQLKLTCMSCTMCSLGQRDACKDHVIRDPHVFSSMEPSRIVVVGQNPGWEELEKNIPFVGAAGRNFDAELAANGTSREQLYIANTVRCYTDFNAKPDAHTVARCAPFLQMEFNILNPKLVVALGAVAFSRLCPSAHYATNLGKIVRSEVYGLPVMPILHPSPLNLQQQARRREFARQMKILCSVIARLTA